jgi:Na+/glutamate symporter
MESLIGIAMGQASYGMLTGLAAGIVLALAQWLLSRRS